MGRAGARRGVDICTALRSDLADNTHAIPGPEAHFSAAMSQHLVHASIPGAWLPSTRADTTDSRTTTGAPEAAAGAIDSGCASFVIPFDNDVGRRDGEMGGTCEQWQFYASLFNLHRKEHPLACLGWILLIRRTA